MAVTINERPATTVSFELLEQLREIPPATIGHMLDFGFMDRTLRPVGKRNFTLCGPAVTVRTAVTDSGVVHKAIGMAEPGDVMVIDRNGDDKYACWGELTSLAAKMQDLAGTIVDGPGTDLVEVEEMEYLVFCRGIAPITSRSTGQSGEINTVVQCGGVNVEPGDIILADDNGAMVVPPDRVAEIVEHCGPRVGYEAMIRDRILAGEQIADITGANRRIAETRGEG